MSKDLSIYDNGTGGELSIISDDLALQETLLSIAYLAMFGGNVEANTKGNELQTDIRTDYWANSLFYDAKPKQQFNSNFERALAEVSYNSAGRLALETALKKDLKVLDGIANYTIAINIVTTDRVRVSILLQRLQGGGDSALQFIYDNASGAVIIDTTL